jgi:hypothetical protein
MVAVLSEKSSELPKNWERDYAVVSVLTGIAHKSLYRLVVEGDIPKSGPRMLIAPHQFSLDAISIMRAVDDKVVFIYGKYDGRKRRIIDAAIDRIGSIQANSRHVQRRRFFEHMNEETVIAGFPQGIFQVAGVESVSDGIVHLGRMYEAHTGSSVAFIPAGIEYGHTNRLPKRAPIPVFNFPFPSTKVTVRFGQPEFLDGRTPAELTEVVMRESARLSNLPYNVHQ